MSKIGVHNWASLLWEYYIPQIQSGEPFYLAADKKLLFDLGRSKLSSIADEKSALEDFNSACADLLSVRRSNVTLKPTASHRGSYSKTPIICLAVQQVLVVEHMLSDPKFTENAYFPRYRQILGLEAADQAVSPLNRDDFQLIWDTLKREILSVPGGVEKSITFAPGNIRRDLNRQLPMSQALFTTNDLQRIYEKLGAGERWDNEQVTKQLLYKVKGYLGSRAQRIISEYDFGTFSRLCQQISSFMKNPERRSHVRIWRRDIEHGANNEIVVFLDSQEIFDDVFSLYISSNIQQPQLETELSLVLSQKCEDGVVPILRVDRDRYVEMSSGEGVCEGDSVLAIMVAGNKPKFISALSSKGIEWQQSFQMAKSNLPQGFELYRADNLGSDFAQRLNSLILPDQGVSQTLRLVTKGGLLADGRTHTYLSGYPPESIEHNSRPLHSDEMIRVNSTDMSVGELMEILRLQRGNKNYAIEYMGDATHIILSPANLLKEVYKFGFLLSSEKLTPTTSALGAEDPSLNGFSLTASLVVPVSLVEPLNPKTVAFLLAGQGDTLAEVDRAWLLERAKNSGISTGVAKVLEKRLVEGKFILTPELRQQVQTRKLQRRNG